MWLRTSHKAQVGGGHGYAGGFVSFPPILLRGGGSRVNEGETGCLPRGGCDIVSIVWTSFSTICVVGVGLGGSIYHTGMPKVNP